MKELRVLKPFMFTHAPSSGEQRLSEETRFVPGIYQVEDHIANHPWIRAGADGKIESAAQAAVRVVEEAERQKAADADRAEATAAAEAAVARLAQAETRRVTEAKDSTDELNTSVENLKNRPKGSELAVAGRVGTPEEITKELNTPVSVLRKKQGTALGVVTKS
jgi:hypothetical protein